MNNNHGPYVMIVFDGFGINIPFEGNAISKAKMPIFDNLWETSPHTLLSASGESVGLPHGLAGNSEVGHLNLGAGRIVVQELTKINEAIKNKTFYRNPVLLSAIKWAKAEGSHLHLMGLLSDGGVHSDFRHIFPLLEMAKDNGYKKQVYIHCFTDGRDVPPRSARKYFQELEAKIAEIGIGQISTIVGRNYAMDRAHNWERIKQVYEMMLLHNCRKVKHPFEALRKDYREGLNDQFIKPTVVQGNGKPPDKLHDGDVVIFFNLRSERARQLSKPFVVKDFKEFERKKVLDDLFFVGMTNFGDDLPMSVAFPEFPLVSTLPEILSKEHLKQLYLAEEEKYAHVTYFFHGGSTIDIPGEKKIMVDSVEVEDYSEAPEMSSHEVLDILLDHINNEKEDFILVNFPNPDMLAHTGNIEATIKTLECLDGCLKKILEAIKKQEGTLIVTSDHGNAEMMFDPQTETVLTEHSTSPVPFIIYNSVKDIKLREGILSDVAPTILDLIGIPKPNEMTRKSLIIQSKK